MAGPLNGPQVRDKIIEQGMKATESTAYFLGNLTKTVQDTTKSGLTIDSGRHAATRTYKAGKDFARGDSLCAGLCCVSIGCETIAGVLVWVPIPVKITTITVLKTTSISCQRFRDLCAQDGSSSFC